MGFKRKILFLLPSLRGGGAERTLINLLHKLDYDRYEIDLVVVSKYGPYINQIPEEVRVQFLFHNIFFVRVLSYLHRKFDVSWFFRKKMSKIRKKYDLAISFLDSNFTDLLFFIHDADKRVAFVHGSYLTHSNYERFYKYNNYKAKLKNKRYNFLDGIFFVSNDSMSDFIHLFGEFPNMGVVFNMIDRKNVIEKSEIPAVFCKNPEFTFAAVGSLLPIKGFDRLVRAAKIVKNKDYVFKLEIAGSGPEEHKLQKLIRENGLEAYITLHGFQSNPYPLMKNSDVFVMSSVSEALPTVLCEAMILGLPSLVTNCSGCRGLVEKGEYGLMAEQDDQDLAEKMMKYMDNPELLRHYSRKSLERAELFDDERVLQAYYDIFDWKEPVPAQHKDLN